MTIKEAYKLLEQINKAIKAARKVNHYMRADWLTARKKDIKRKILITRTKPNANLAHN